MIVFRSLISISSFVTLNASCFTPTADHVRSVSRTLDCVVSVELFPNSQRIASTLCKRTLKFIFVKKKFSSQEFPLSVWRVEWPLKVCWDRKREQHRTEEDRFLPQPITFLGIEFAVSVCGVVNMCVCVSVCVRSNSHYKLEQKKWERQKLVSYPILSSFIHSCWKT